MNGARPHGQHSRSEPMYPFGSRTFRRPLALCLAKPSHLRWRAHARFSSCDGRRQLTPRETELITRLHLPAAAEAAAPKVRSRVRHFGWVFHCGGRRRTRATIFQGATAAEPCCNLLYVGAQQRRRCAQLLPNPILERLTPGDMMVCRCEPLS